MKAPRGLLVLPDGDIIVADMGGWQAGEGRIWRLMRSPEHAGPGFKKVLLFNHLDRPNGLALGPDENVYVATVGRIARFSPGSSAPALQDVVGGISGVAPLPGKGRHLLSSILFDTNKDLIVGVGSASDHCENADGQMEPGDICRERTGNDALGVIRKYTMQWRTGKASGWALYARGLRNSMAMAIDPRTGALWQGDNGRDAINAAMPELKNDDELPHDELNMISAGGDYGWPYCYDSGVPSPEYPRSNCRNYQSPARLLPAHSAPLGMAFYMADKYPSRFAGSLLVTYHGYRKHGHRVVALLSNRSSGPLGESVTLVDGKRGHPNGLGAPVGIAVGADGDVYVSDDHDGIVVLLHYDGLQTLAGAAGARRATK
jgi:glucose/arabinose dehydrogenase